ncbi:unnamed protein product [marine sediment metagenome]|uniref:Carboxypeptidase regulatory-like domain-containing protein n=2 Tax=marine sediment metagenome TaxID=412755 RepID=X1RIS7_9ZZZZ
MLGYGIYVLTRPKAPPAPPPPSPGLANLYGVVIDAETGKALPDALVTLNNWRKYTDEDGYYSFIDLVPADYTISFSKDGYEPVDYGVISVKEGNNEISVSLAPVISGAGIYGTVTDAQTGEPIPMVIVETAYAITQTDTLGDYSFPNLEIGDYSVEFRKAGYHTALKVITLTLAGIEVNVQLEPAPPTATLFGVVTDAVTHEPIAGVRVEIRNKITQTNTLGEYYFDGLPVLDYCLTTKYTKSGYYDEARSTCLVAGDNQFNVEMLSTTITGMPSDEEIEKTKALVRSRLDSLAWDVCADIHYTPEMNNKIAQVLEPIWALQKRIDKAREEMYEQALIDARYYETKEELERQAAEMGQKCFFCGWEITQIKSYLTSIGLVPAGRELGIRWTGEVFLTPRWAGEPDTILGYLTNLVGGAGAWNTCGASWAQQKIVCVGYYYFLKGMHDTLVGIQENCRRSIGWDDLVRKRGMLFYGVWYCGYPLGY